MEAAEALALLRAQYHDFLNHLQVILGFLELGREDRAREQIGRAVKDIASRGQVAKCGLPEVAWLLLLFQAEALKVGIKVFFEIEKASTFPVAPSGLALISSCHQLILKAGKDMELLVVGRPRPEGYLLRYVGKLNWEEVASKLNSPQVTFGPEDLSIRLLMGEF